MPPDEGLRLRVVRKTVEVEGICSFELVADNGASLPAFEAGAHIDVHTPGRGLVRQYSLLNPPACGAPASCYRIGVLEDPASRGGSTSMHRDVQVGGVLRAGTPRNHFALERSAQSFLLLAGGIGITPIFAMAESLHAQCRGFELHYAARSAARMAFRTQIASRPWARHAALHVDDGPVGQRLDLATCLARPQPGRHLYACGPAGFLAAVQSIAQSSGWAPGTIHFEHFSNTMASNSTASNTAADAAEAEFELRIASTGRIIPVACGQSVVQALAACGIEIPVSCEQGVCGTCVTPVLEGLPEHRDLYLTDAEHAQNRLFTPCCSRSLTPQLVLGL